VKPVEISGITREYLKDKMNELATNSKINNIRDLYKGINEFKRSYIPRNNLVKGESDVRLEVPKAVTMKTAVFWDVMPCVSY
jgi:hypothetical protein